MAEATLTKDYDTIEVTVPTGGYSAGQILQLADGRASYVLGQRALAAGETASLKTGGQVQVPKATSIKLLDGQDVFWDESASVVTYRRNNDKDFHVGTVIGDAGSSDTTCVVNLNVKAKYVIAMGDGISEWVNEATLGLGVTAMGGGGAKLEFDAVAEAAQAAIYSSPTVSVDANPIMEGWFAIYSIGDNAALDVTIGLASGSHATDFQSVANFVTAHLDGTDLSVLVESDDGTTDVAPVDSTVDVVDDTRFFLQIDARDKTNVRVLLNGVDIVPSGTTLVLTAASNELRPIVHIEKTSDDTVADVRVFGMGVRTAA